MIPHAVIVHRSEGRCRLRVPSRRRDSGYFQRVRDTLSELPGVEQVITNAKTGSVLLVHSSTDAAVIDGGRDADLFEVDEEDARGPSVFMVIQERIEQTDAAIRARTKNDVSLETLAFYALIGSAGYQLKRGNLFPPGVSLLIHAFSLLARRVDVERGEAAAKLNRGGQQPDS